LITKPRCGSCNKAVGGSESTEFWALASTVIVFALLATDLIVGARYADPSGKLNAGKSSSSNSA
jgi:hypothetical protein